MIYCQTFADAGVMQIFKCHPTTYCCWISSLSRCSVFGGVSCFSVLGSPFAPAHSVKRDSATRGTYMKCAQLHLKCKCGTSSFHKQSAGKHLHNRCAAYSLMWGQNKQNHPELEVFREKDGRDRSVCRATEEQEVTQSPTSAEIFSSRRWEMYICMYVCLYVFIQGWICVKSQSHSLLALLMHGWVLASLKKYHTMFFARLKAWRRVFGGDFWTRSRNHCKLRHDLIFIWSLNRSKQDKD